ncbi:CRS2-associated factor 2, mitochondrial isoform X1 [Nicotiana tabacum]|uniref:CRS2-associated factor 2, mitochondrial isoform X1 n=1 Tax=Nicotiana tabacum TaxID=4097 RepID=A0A1S4DLK4_TOBAC|nr:PREDICTED: CRS2-associated factor 2, mitochondrial-like isoform X1 [Nicotiana tabacum]
MSKLFPWRHLTRQAQNTLYSKIPSIPSLSFIKIPHFLFHSQPEEEDFDPPFSPTLKPRKPNKKKKGEKKQNASSTEDCEKVHNFTVNSDLPFDYRYSYSETNPAVEPIGFREPTRFSPFGPGRLDRKWTGTSAPRLQSGDLEKVAEERRLVLGEPLSEEETAELVEKYRHDDCSRQINLGRGGVTHNMLEDIHSHWKRAEAVRIKCLGVPTLNMDNVCSHLEDKSGGKVVYRHINILLLYRGRNYDPKSRPTVPVMLWKPLAPIYPKLVKNVADGLTFEETKAMRNKGLNAPPLTKLSRNGVYVYVVDKVRVAFETEEVIRLDCTHVGTSDCKRIGVKLRDLVPCVPILFKDEQIILWRGKKDEEQNSGS